MTAVDVPHEVGDYFASILLVGDCANGDKPLPVLVGSLLRQLGLLADPATEWEAHGLSGDPIALRFGASDVWLTFGEGAPSSASDRIPGAAVVPIWQGVPACPIAEGAPWLQLDIPIAAGDDQVICAQRLCSLGALLASQLSLVRLCWLPNQLWTDGRRLAEAVIAVERQGLPPVMHLIGFIPTADGSVATRGLNWFGLEDLRIAGPETMTIADLVRRAARLAAEQLAMRAPLRHGRYPGIERNEWVSITPADAGRGQLLCEAVVEPPRRR